VSDDATAADGAARPASVDDLKRLLAALAAEQVDYVLIGGYALYALGYQRATTDIDLLLRPTLEQGERTRRALLTLPDRVAMQLDPAWFAEGETIRVADAFVVDLLFSTCGESIDSLRDHIVGIDLDGVPLRTLDLEGLLKTKQSARDKDKLDRMILERALQAVRRGGKPA
jgi:predicted nucleotidyltransferase